MKDYDKAKIMNKKIFYEHYSDTLRSYPENYCVAERKNHRWIAYNDGALKAHWKAIQKILDDWQNGSTSEALAGILHDYFIGRIQIKL